jgi:hypothetical protein
MTVRGHREATGRPRGIPASGPFIGARADEPDRLAGVPIRTGPEPGPEEGGPH